MGENAELEMMAGMLHDMPHEKSRYEKLKIEFGCAGSALNI
jgi:hypothetical protein